MIEIERAWGKEPGWFDTLPRPRQVQLLGWYRIHRNPTGNPRTSGQRDTPRVVNGRNGPRSKVR